MKSFQVDVNNAVAQIERIKDGLTRAVDAALNSCAQAGAITGRTDTFYTPRSGAGLQSKTIAKPAGQFKAQIIANTFYASWVNFGNGPQGGRIYPTRAKALHFFLPNGQEVFARSVKVSTPRPFMTNVKEKVEDTLAQFMEAAIRNLLSS